MEDKIKYTSENIQALEGRVHVRMRPKMYFDKCFKEQSLDRFPLEIACHAIDKAMDKKCTFIKITLFDTYFSLEYDAGMSLKIDHDVSRAECIMTKMGTCHNLKKHLSVGDEFCELGIMTINVASEWCRLETQCNGQKGNFLFKEGKTATRSIIPNEDSKNYTKLTLKPDLTLFPNLAINPVTLQQKIDTIRQKLNGFDIQLFVEK